MGQSWWINEPPPRLRRRYSARRSASNPWCNAVGTPGGHNRAPVYHSLPLIRWTSCPRVVATSRAHRRAHRRPLIVAYTATASIHITRARARAPTFDPPLVRGLMIGLDCLANMGEPRIDPPSLAGPPRSSRRLPRRRFAVVSWKGLLRIWGQNYFRETLIRDGEAVKYCRLTCTVAPFSIIERPEMRDDTSLTVLPSVCFYLLRR